MKKFIASLTFVIAFAVYVAYQNSGSAAASLGTVTTPAQTPTNTLATVAGGPSTSAQSAPPEPSSNTSSNSGSNTTPQKQTTSPAPKPKGQYTDGTYTGSVADAYYGNVQVQVNVQGGKIANVQFLQYPNDRSTSRYINSQAMPMLQQEAIAAQSANIDGVSGATDTSAAFQQSLASALAQAKA